MHSWPPSKYPSHFHKTQTLSARKNPGYNWQKYNNTTHLVLLKSLLQGKQLRILGSELDGITANFLEDCYTTSTRNPFGHLLIDLTPSCPITWDFAQTLQMKVWKSVTFQEESISQKQLPEDKQLFCQTTIARFTNTLLCTKETAQIQSNKNWTHSFASFVLWKVFKFG